MYDPALALLWDRLIDLGEPVTHESPTLSHVTARIVRPDVLSLAWVYNGADGFFSFRASLLDLLHYPDPIVVSIASSVLHSGVTND